MAGKNRIGKRPPSPNAPATPLKRVLKDPSTYRLAFYRGSRAQQRKAIEELREGAERAERKVITFNCQRYARQERVWPLMVQSLVLRIQDLVADHIDLESKVDGLLRSLDEFIDGQLSQSRKVRLLESLDYELEGLLKVALTKSPLVVLVKGLGTLEPRAMVELVEFISGSLEIRRLCFVMSLHESAITKGLDEHYRGESPLTAQEFLEEAFPAAKRSLELSKSSGHKKKSQALVRYLRKSFAGVKFSQDERQKKTLQEGYIILDVDKPLINKQKKAVFTAIKDRFAKTKVKLPKTLYLPFGEYRANGAPFKIEKGKEATAVLFLFAEPGGEGGVSWLLLVGAITGAAALVAGVGALIFIRDEHQDVVVDSVVVRSD